MTSQLGLASDWWSRMHGPDAEGHRVAFEQWLAADPRNRELYATLEAAWQEVAVAGESRFAQDRALDRHGPPFGLTTPRVTIAAFAAAAAILLAVYAQPAARGPLPVATAQQLQTPLGEIRTIDLPDGSRVTLDTDSQVKVRFAADSRRAELVHGRARFEVHADPSRIFIVEALDRQVSATEGSFDAAVVPKGLYVSAWRGPLDIRDRGALITSAALFRLAPGQSLDFAPDQASQPKARSAERGAAQWPAGMLVFRNTPLSQVLAQTNRYSRKRIVLGDPSLSELRVTGTFRPLPVDALAASLAAAFRLRIDVGSDGNIILERPLND